MKNGKLSGFFEGLSKTKKILITVCLIAVVCSMSLNIVLAVRLNHPEEEPEEVETTESRLELLRESLNNSLYEDLVPQLASYIETNGYTSDTWSFAVIDTVTGDIASWNSHPMCSASIIKQFIMGAIFDDYENILKYYSESDVQGYLTGMITISDNDCANALIAIAGYGDVDTGIARINAWAKKNGYTQTRLDHQFYTEAVPEEDNQTSALDNALLQYDIVSGKYEHSEDMLNLLKASTVTYKIPAGIPDSSVVTANKTGDLDIVENDCAIIFAENGTYILSIMTSGLINGKHARQIMRDVSAMTYNYFKDLDRSGTSSSSAEEEQETSAQTEAN